MLTSLVDIGLFGRYCVQLSAQLENTRLIGELCFGSQDGIREKPFCIQKTHDRIQGARLVSSLGYAVFGPKMASSSHVTEENWSLYVAILPIYSSARDVNKIVH